MVVVQALQKESDVRTPSRNRNAALGEHELSFSHPGENKFFVFQRKFHPIVCSATRLSQVA